MKGFDDISDPSNFLEGARPFSGENRFILGTFERGITVYRQQIRALNLVYSLVHARDSMDRIPKRSRIAVIGGGAFGTTVATAAAYAGFGVVLLERHQTLLHLQRGCDTRWLHPRFYDWPAPESESLMARLPFLDWFASSAGQVAAQIEREVMDLKTGALSPRLEIDVGISELKVEQSRKGLYEVRYSSDTGQYIRPCEIVVYAVGFGFESNHGGDNDSYWRNDRFGQSDLNFTGQKIRYVVSGFGDGGLVDVFRLTLRDFRYERIFGEMFSRHGRQFLAALDQLRTSHDRRPGSLYDNLASLEMGTYKEAFRKAKGDLKERLRSDTSVTLNGTAGSFRLGLSLQNLSFSNALLAFLLFRLDAVKYKCGQIDAKDPDSRRLSNAIGRKARPEWLRKASSVIVRHGTDRESALKAVECRRAIEFLGVRSRFDTGQQIFPAGWWGQYVDPTGTAASRKTPAPVEYVPPLLRTHATTFVSTLASVLAGLIDRRHRPHRGLRKPKFRVTLHRLTQFERKDYFQQVTPYKGRVASGGVGRFFPVEGGIVGLACRTGSLVVAKKNTAAQFRRIWQLTDLNVSGAKNIKPYVYSLLCCPFFAPESGKSQHVILALFVDSADPDFFDDEAQRTISYACRGFVDLLESLHNEGMLRALPAAELGYNVPPSAKLAPLRKKLERLGVRFVDASSKGWKKGLTFRTLRSLDFQVSYQDP